MATKTDSKDPFNTVLAHVVGATERAIKLKHATIGNAEWIPRSCFSYHSEQEADENGSDPESTAEYEVRAWKLRELGWQTSGKSRR